MDSLKIMKCYRLKHRDGLAQLRPWVTTDGAYEGVIRTDIQPRDPEIIYLLHPGGTEPPVPVSEIDLIEVDCPKSTRPLRVGGGRYWMPGDIYPTFTE